MKIKTKYNEDLEIEIRNSYWRDGPSGIFHGDISDIPAIDSTILEKGEVIMPVDCKFDLFSNMKTESHTMSNKNENKQERIDKTRLKQAEDESKLSNCVKHSVGCIITDWQGKILSSGYNGTPPGHQNCSDKFPNWEQDKETLLKMDSTNRLHEELLMNQVHHEWSAEHELHAEVNALLHSDPHDRIGGTLYVNLEPCPNCAKMIAASGVSRVVFGRKYHRSDSERTSKMLADSGIQYIFLDGVI